MTSTYSDGNYPWIPDNSDNTYSNPVLFADYSDPDVIRVKDNFYLISPSFNQSPGIPVLKSKDLVNWKIISYAIKQPPGDKYKQMQPGCGVWAPAIRYHNDKFWIFFPMPDEGIYVTTAVNAEGPWCEPWLLLEGKGIIDPCPLWDDDGTAWLIFAYAKSRSGIKHKLHVRPMSTDGKKLLDQGKIVFDGTEDHPTLEGPKFHKFNDYYYISAPAGGVPYGWQVILRSKNIYGPYNESKIVLAQNGSIINGPHQGALIDDINGKWWFMHFQEHLPYGRICHLQPVTWIDGWPMMNKPKLLSTKPSGKSEIFQPQTSDDFNASKLGLQWAFQGSEGYHLYSLTERSQYLRLKAGHQGIPDICMAPHAIVQKSPARQFIIETELDINFNNNGLEAGLGVFGLDSASIVITRLNDENYIGVRVNNELIMKQKTYESSIKLILRFEKGGHCQFGMKGADDIYWLGPSFHAKEGKWIGVRLGLYCSSYGPEPLEGHADFKYFNFHPLNDYNQKF